MTCHARPCRRSPRRNCGRYWVSGRTAATDREYLSVIASASEAIHAATKQEWIASSQVLLAMTAFGTNENTGATTCWASAKHLPFSRRYTSQRQRALPS